MARSWTPIAVEFAPGALNAIRSQVAQVFTRDSRNSKDVRGLLCGAIVEFATVSLVRIDHVIPIVANQSANPFPNADKQHFSKAIAESPRDVIGWYRSQTPAIGATSNDSKSPGADDRTWSAELFPSGKSAFLVCFPEEDLNLPGSLYIWADGVNEVSTSVNLGRQFIPSGKPQKVAEAPVPPAEEKNNPVTGASRKSHRDALLLALATVIVAVGAFFLVRGRVVRPSGEPSGQTRSSGIAMKLERTGDELQVSWNPQAAEVKQATGGNLIIAENERNLTLKLGPQQLESGHLLYKTQAEDVRMDLEIVGPFGTYVESVRAAAGLPGLNKSPEAGNAVLPGPKSSRFDRAASPVNTAAVPVTPEHGAPPPATETALPPERRALRAFVPPPQVTTAGKSVVVPAPEAPQLAGSASPAAVSLPDLKLPVPKPPQEPQNTAQPKLEEYVGPRAIRSVQPAFDASANRTIDNALAQNHDAHEVQVEVTIDEHGKVTKAAKGLTTGPFAYLFVDAALAAARRWQFEPASLGGRAVSSKMTLKFAFVRNH